MPILRGLVRVLTIAMAALATAGAAFAQSPPTTEVYKRIGASELRAFVFTPASSSASPPPAVLMFHGGGWSSGAPDWVFARANSFATLGLVAIPIEYRLSNDRITPADAVRDACAAFAWVRGNAQRLGIDPKRVAAYGVSAGGNIAATAAARGCGADRGPDMLLLWSPAVDVGRDRHFARLLRGASPIAWSPVDIPFSRMPPTSIVQGDADTLTPLRGARHFCERVRETRQRCDLNVFRSVGHLLTRNLKNQESDYDPDPTARAAGIAAQDRFLLEVWSDLKRVQRPH